MKYLVGEDWRSRRGNIKYLDDLRILGRKNRRQMTTSEKIFWDIVRNKRLGYLFLRQKPINRVIFDFYCSKLLLAVEIDGGYHKQRSIIDVERDLLVSRLGIKTIRIKSEMLKNEKLVNVVIKDELLKRESELKER